MIDITTYNDDFLSLVRFRQDLLACLGNNVFAATDKLLCFHIIGCLKHPLLPIPDLDEQQLRKCCEVLQKIFDDKFRNWNYSVKGVSAASPFQLFIANLLEFKSLPAYELLNLERKVKQDLEKRHALISYYEAMPFIQLYKKGERKRGDHQQNICLAFYLRNTEEQQTIIDHLLHGIAPRALAKSRRSVTDSLALFEDGFFDRPYLTAYGNNESYFDDRAIDRVYHRLPLEISGGRALQPLYDNDKELFYQQLIALYSFDKVIHDIRDYLARLGVFNAARKELFTELIELFEQKKFYGFYALALAQVEGLFAEMVLKIDSKASKNSLPEKVKAVRPWYGHSAREFDYFEYYVPAQRNKFMHTGVDDDIRLKSYDLIFDVRYLLATYLALEVPVVRLSQVIKRREQEHYFTEDGFIAYFRLLHTAKKHPEFAKLEAEVNDFQNGFLSTLDLDLLADEINDELPKTIHHLTETIQLFTESNARKKMPPLWDFAPGKSNKEYLLKHFTAVYSAHQDIFQKIDGYRYFFESALRIFGAMPEPAKLAMRNILKNNLEDFQKVKVIVEAIT